MRQSASRTAPGEAKGRAELHVPVHVRDRLPGGQREAVALVMIEGLVYAGATALPDVPMGPPTSRLVREPTGAGRHAGRVSDG